MTSSYNLSHRPRIIFFHGLNNNPEGFEPLRRYFEQRGYLTDMIILPCHGEDRFEARNDKEALELFSTSMKKLEGIPYYAIAFSHGALYLQLWMEKNLPYKPIKQVLLSPALFIRKQSIIAKILPLLPRKLSILSLQPKRFRRYNMLSTREYDILVQGILDWQNECSVFKVPTTVFIDPADELVDAQKVKYVLEKINPDFKVTFWERPGLKLGLGAHHILFHPDYFSKEGWEMFTGDIERFFNATDEKKASAEA